MELIQIADLSARVRAATGPNRNLDRELMALSYRWDKRDIGATCGCCAGGKHLDEVWVDPTPDAWVTTAVDGFEFTGDLTYALALGRRLFPDAFFKLESSAKFSACDILNGNEDELGWAARNDANIALTLVDATLHALHQRGQPLIARHLEPV